MNYRVALTRLKRGGATSSNLRYPVQSMFCLSMCQSIWLFASPNSNTHPKPNYLTEIIRAGPPGLSFQAQPPRQGLQPRTSRPGPGHKGHGQDLIFRKSRLTHPLKEIKLCPLSDQIWGYTSKFFVFINTAMNQIKCLIRFAKYKVST